MYEAMFLFDSSDANKDWDGLVEHAQEMLAKHGASIIEWKKWDERKLAYPINDVRRGTYLLVYFEMPPENVSKLKRDLALAGRVMRILILQDDEIPARLEAEKVAAEKKEAELAAAAAENADSGSSD